MTHNEFITWLEKEYAKHFTISTSKKKSINELVYTLRMCGTGRDFCLNIIDDDGGCVCVPSVNETFIPTRHLKKKIECIEYDTEEPDYPIVIVKV